MMIDPIPELEQALGPTAARPISSPLPYFTRRMMKPLRPICAARELAEARAMAVDELLSGP